MRERGKVRRSVYVDAEAWQAMKVNLLRDGVSISGWLRGQVAGYLRRQDEREGATGGVLSLDAGERRAVKEYPPGDD